MTIILNGTTGITTPGITNQGVVEFTAGSVGAPSLTTTSDTNTGIYFPAADTIAFTEGGVESMRINSSGNVGIGTASPATKLQVGDGTATIEIRIDADGGSGQGGFIRGYKDTSNPSWFLGDLNPIAGGANAGLCAYVYNTDPFVVFTGGSEKLRLDSSGNLGLGVTPNVWLSSFRAIQLGQGSSLWGAATGNNAGFDSNAYVNTSGGSIYVGSTFATRYQQNDGKHMWNTAASGTAGNAISFTQAMTLHASGGLSVGNTLDPGAKSFNLGFQNGVGNLVGTLNFTGYVAGYGAGIASYVPTGSPGVDYQDLRFYTSAGPSFINTERARITSGGDLLVGGTSSSGRLTTKGSGTGNSTYSLACQNSSGTNHFLVRDDGFLIALQTYSNTDASAANMYISSGGAIYRSTSSLKYKKDVQDAVHGLAKLLTLRPVTYKGINNGTQVFGGLIAEEVHDAGLTEFVQYADDGSPDALAYGNMVSLAIKAIQEQQAMIKSLEAKVTALESK